MTTATIEKGVETPAPPPDKEKPKDKTGKAPPKKGICCRCGLDRPINRLMLCYPCWVKTSLEERGKGWHEGMDHPKDCGCVGLGEHGVSPFN